MGINKLHKNTSGDVVRLVKEIEKKYIEIDEKRSEILRLLGGANKLFEVCEEAGVDLIKVGVPANCLLRRKEHLEL